MPVLLYALPLIYVPLRWI